MRVRIFQSLCAAAFIAFIGAPSAQAWGPQGHALVGKIADEVLAGTPAGQKVGEILETYTLEDAADLAMGDGSPAIGEIWPLGDASLTFLSGFPEVPEDWDVGGNSTSKQLNAVSVVTRLDYAGKSILFTGDAVGRSDEGPADEILGTEKFLVDHDAGDRRLRADILQVPHHGANNASSTAFIHAVAPTFVIFPAGSSHAHPRADAWERYEAAGIAAENMLRTDVGDRASEKQQPGAWDARCTDKMGDDGISI